MSLFEVLRVWVIIAYGGGVLWTPRQRKHGLLTLRSAGIWGGYAHQLATKVKRRPGKFRQCVGRFIYREAS